MKTATREIFANSAWACSESPFVGDKSSSYSVDLQFTESNLNYRLSSRPELEQEDAREGT